MSNISKIRKALATLPQTQYADGLGSNTRVIYNARTKSYRTQNGNEYTFDEIFKVLCNRSCDEDGRYTDETKELERIFEKSF